MDSSLALVKSRISYLIRTPGEVRSLTTPQMRGIFIDSFWVVIYYSLIRPINSPVMKKRISDLVSFPIDIRNLFCCYTFSGVPKPANFDQPTLIRSVVRLVRQLIRQFNETDIVYVRNIRSNKSTIYNVECRSIAVASAVKSTFAGLVKSAKPPAYLKGVSRIYLLRRILMWSKCDL